MYERMTVEHTAVGGFSDLIQDLIDAPSSFDAACAALAAWRTKSTPIRDAGARALDSVVEHLLFLFSEGSQLFASCEVRVMPDRQVVVRLQRVARVDDVRMQVTARAGVGRIGSDFGRFHAFREGPSLVIDCQPVRIRSIGEEVQLTDADIDTFYRIRQTLCDEIVRERSHACVAAAVDRAARRQNRAEAAAAYRAVACLVPPGQPTRPWPAATLHVLPRLVRPPAGVSVLAFLRDRLARIKRMGFGALMLGIVDRQSVSAYIGEDDTGGLTVYPNNHGYWSSGEAGIDPALGTMEEYEALVAASHALGLRVVQDALFGTLGYPAQLPALSLSALDDPTRCLMLGAHETPVADSARFLHEPDGWIESTLADQADEASYTAILDRYHHAPVFALPRPDLYRSEVLDAILQRTLTQRRVGVDGFRIDMAKHIPFTVLRTLMQRLRATNGARPCWFLLEYWSLNYFDLALAAQALSGCGEETYFYDFPLAAALHAIFTRAAPYGATVADLLVQRNRWPLPQACLVPTFIDHDFMFRPIYDGSAHSCAKVLAGYALALVLSDNPPYVYVGFDDPAARGSGASGMGEFDSRQPMSDFFADEARESPAPALGKLLRAFDELGLPGAWTSAPQLAAAEKDQVRVRRSAKVAGNDVVLDVLIADAEPFPPEGNLLFRNQASPFVQIRLLACE